MRAITQPVRNCSKQPAQGVDAPAADTDFEKAGMSRAIAVDDSAPECDLVRFDPSGVVDDEGRRDYGGPRSGAAAIVKVLAKIMPTEGQHPERNDIPWCFSLVTG